MSLLISKEKLKSPGSHKDKDEKDKSKKSSASAAEATSPRSDPDPEVRAAVASGQWKEIKDKNGKIYYFNPKTKKTTWDLKKELAKGGEASSPSVAKQESKPAPPASLLGKKELPPPSQKAAEPADMGPPPPTSPQQPEESSTTITNTTSTNAGGKNVAFQEHSSSSFAQHESGLSEPSSAPSELQPPPVASGGGGNPSLYSTMATYQVNPSTKMPQQQQQPYGGVGSGAPSSSSLLLSAEQYRDPVARLMQENSTLQQLVASGSRGQVALDFQTKYDALIRTNSALTTEMGRMKHEYDAMARALTEANRTIHEQQLIISQGGFTASDRTKDEELQHTISHLREQNRVLVTQISELSTLLARGLNEVASLPAFSKRFTAEEGSQSGATVITRFLDSSARQVLCPNCLLGVTRFRDKMLSPVETNVGKSLNYHTVDGGASGGMNAPLPVYQNVPDVTVPPPTHYYSDPHAAAVDNNNNNNSRGGGGGGSSWGGMMQGSDALHHSSFNSMGAQGGGAQQQARSGSGSFGNPYGIPPAANVRSGSNSGGGSGHLESPAVMYGGFVIRSPKVPS